MSQDTVLLPLFLLESVNHLQHKEVLQLELGGGQSLLQVWCNVVLAQGSPHEGSGVHHSFIAEISGVSELDKILDCNLRLSSLRPDVDNLGLVAGVELESPVPLVHSLLVAELIEELRGGTPLALARKLSHHLLSVLVSGGLGALVSEAPADDAVTLSASHNPLLGLSRLGGRTLCAACTGGRSSCR